MVENSSGLKPDQTTTSTSTSSGEQRQTPAYQQKYKPSAEDVHTVRRAVTEIMHENDERARQKKRATDTSSVPDSYKRAVAFRQLRERQSAETDPITRLPNRIAYQRELNRVVALSRNHNQPYAAGIADANNLKIVNDNGGHKAGDEYLRTIAEELKGTLRQGDRAFRTGGDEFTVLLETDEEGAEQWASRATEALGGKASIGTAAIDVNDVEGSIQRADERMYAAKTAYKTENGETPR